MNRIFVSLDGDGAGSVVGQSVLMDDAQGLHDISNKIKEGIRAVESMVSSAGGQIISSGGDELVAFIDPQNEHMIEEMRQKFQEITGFTASIGTGFSLSQSGKALLAAKLTGKNKTLQYDPSLEEVIQQAHQAVSEGHGDPEQTKLDEHYIDPTMDQTSDDEMPEDEMPEDVGTNEEYFDDSSEESPEDMMALPEGMEDGMPEDEMAMEDQNDGMVPDDYPEDVVSDIAPAASDEEMNPEDMVDAQDYQEEEEEEPPISEFEQEEPIALLGDDKLPQDDEANAEKADDEEAALPPEGDSFETDGADLDAELADADTNEALLQQIAANLDAFKQNKDLMDQIKEAKPELYAAILGLLHNMIELAKMIDPEAVSPSEPEMPEEQNVQVPAGPPPGDQQIPKPQS